MFTILGTMRASGDFLLYMLAGRQALEPHLSYLG